MIFLIQQRDRESRVIKDMRFQEPGGGICVISYPFTFSDFERAHRSAKQEGGASLSRDATFFIPYSPAHQNSKTMS